MVFFCLVWFWVFFLGFDFFSVLAQKRAMVKCKNIILRLYVNLENKQCFFVKTHTYLPTAEKASRVIILEVNNVTLRGNQIECVQLSFLCFVKLPLKHKNAQCKYVVYT